MSLLSKSVVTPNHTKRQVMMSLFVFAVFISSSPVVLAADLAAGKDKSMMCMGCHGEQGISVSPEIPNLAGQKAAYLVNTLKDFRAQIRKNPIMFSMAGGLSDADIENLAAYYSSLNASQKSASQKSASQKN